MLIGKSGNDSISFDLQILIETRLLIQSNSGGGKSYAIRRLLEQSFGQVQQIVIDLEGEFSTLREKFDYIIAGKSGDTPANPKTAKLLAQRILELGVSSICDLSELKAHDRISFVRYFLESLMDAPRNLWHPVLIIIDESHHFCPERGEAESHQAVIDLATRGRKRGFCAVLATQRLSKLHKDACAELLNKMIGRTSLDIDQARAADELGMIGKADRIALRNLEPGEFHIYGPALNRNGKHENGVIAAKVGAVISRHPKVGARQLEAPPKPTAKIKEILGQLADLPAEAEKQAQDVATLKKDNAELRRKLTIVEKAHPQVKPCDHGPIITAMERQARETERLVTNREAECRKTANDVSKLLATAIDKIGLVFGKLEINFPNLEIKKLPNPVKTEPIKRSANPGPKPDPPEGITRPQQRILDTLASFEALDLNQVHKNMVAAFSGASPTSGGYFNNLGRLRTMELIDYPESSYVCLTDAGRAIAEVKEPISNISDLHESWYKILPAPQAKILKALIAMHPDEISKNDLAEQVEVSSSSGGYFNNLGRLRTLGAIEYPRPGSVKAADILFPEI